MRIDLSKDGATGHVSATAFLEDMPSEHERPVGFHMDVDGDRAMEGAACMALESMVDMIHGNSTPDMSAEQRTTARTMKARALRAFKTRIL